MTVMIRKKNSAQNDFVNWLQKTHPALYKAAMARLGNRPRPSPFSLPASMPTIRPESRYTPPVVAIKPKRYQSPPFRPTGYPSSGFLNLRKRKFSSQMHGMSGMGDWGSFFSDLATGVVDLAPQYLQYKQQGDMLDLQIERARAGLPPIDASKYQTPPYAPQQPPPTQAPAPAPIPVPVGPIYVEPAKPDQKMMMVLGAGVVVAAFFLFKKKRR